MNTRSEELFLRAKKCIPGGVNSPVRAFGSVGLNPVFIERGHGDRITDADGNEYIDYVCSWGPMILGHDNEVIRDAVEKAVKDGLSFGAATEKEVLMAELITGMVPGIEMVRMVNSGTEAVLSAVRLARGYTGRDKIIKFSGCYHGHADSMLVKAGSGLMTQGIPGSSGVTKGTALDTLTAEYNDLKSVESLFTENPDSVAAVIVEPVAANMGVVLPEEGFLKGLRKLCDDNGSVLIFDEVITGFRLAKGGAQEYFNITADLVTFGKIIGGGMPVGAYGGRKEIMEHVSPLGSVYQAGTLSGNPIAMAAGYASLKLLFDTKDFYRELNGKSDRFFREAEKACKDAGINVRVNHIGSLGSIFFTEDEVKDYDSASKSDTEMFARYFKHMLENGIYVAPSQFEAMFISSAHSEEDLSRTLETIKGFGA